MKREETLLQTENVRVRVMELQPGEATHWHFHKEIADYLVALTGVIHLKLRQPEATLELEPGQRCTVEVGRMHQVANGSPSQPASYLLIQGVGRYDFNVVDSPSE
jgi:quercetin dioxygenase-like cupin family protein